MRLMNPKKTTYSAGQNNTAYRLELGANVFQWLLPAFGQIVSTWEEAGLLGRLAG